MISITASSTSAWSTFRAELDLHLGKQSLEDRKYVQAKEQFKRANAYLKRPKLRRLLLS